MIDGVEPTRFALSLSGAVLYSIDPATREPSDLVWVTREGQVTPVDTSLARSVRVPRALTRRDAALRGQRAREDHGPLDRRANGTRQKAHRRRDRELARLLDAGRKALTFISIRSADTSRRRVRVTGAGGRQREGGGDPASSLRHLGDGGVADGRWLVIRTDEKDGDGNVYARRLGRGDTTLIPY